MKKKLFAASFAVIASTALFAQDAVKPAEAPVSPFKFSGMAYAYGSMYKTTTKDKSSSFGSYRFRPFFTYQTENVEATVKLEIDQIFGGSKDNSKFSLDGKQQVDVGNDEKTVEVKAAYLKFNIPALSGFSVKGGADELKTIGAFTCGTEVGLGVINYKTGPADLNLIYAKVWEPNVADDKNDPATEKNDVTLYGVEMGYTISDMIKIKPALYLIQSEKNQVPADSKVAFVGKTALIPSLGASVKVADLTVDFAGAYGTCAKDENDVKFSGYAVDISPVYKVSDAVKAGAFLTMLSGDKPTTADKNESFKSFTIKQDGWGRLFLLENMQTFNNFADQSLSDVRGRSEGYMVAGGFLAYKTSPVEFKVQAAYGKLSQAASGMKKDLGVEIDGQICYEVEKNAKLIFEGAYLKTGKAFGEKGPINSTTKNQPALYAALGMAYKW